MSIIKLGSTYKVRVLDKLVQLNSNWTEWLYKDKINLDEIRQILSKQNSPICANKDDLLLLLEYRQFELDVEKYLTTTLTKNQLESLPTLLYVNIFLFMHVQSGAAGYTYYIENDSEAVYMPKCLEEYT